MAKTSKKVAKKAARSSKKAKTDQQAAQDVLGAQNMQAGNWVMSQFVPPGALGRVGTGIMTDAAGNPITDAQGNPQRIGENADLIARYKNIADKGLSAEEYQAEREQRARGLQSNLNTNLAQLAKAQARGKVYGAAASAQQANALRADQEQRGQLEQDMMLKGAQMKRDALDKYGNTLGNMQAGELERQKTNLGQSNAELAAQMGAFFGTVGMGQQNQYNKKTLDIAKKAVRSI